jgi:hypothetical protein
VDTGNQVVRFGAYKISGNNVAMKYTEFNTINFTFSRSVNGRHSVLIGDLSDGNPADSEPLWYLTKP